MSNKFNDAFFESLYESQKVNFDVVVNSINNLFDGETDEEEERDEDLPTEEEQREAEETGVIGGITYEDDPH